MGIRVVLILLYVLSHLRFILVSLLLTVVLADDHCDLLLFLILIERG